MRSDFRRLFSAAVTSSRCDGLTHFRFWHRWSSWVVRGISRTSRLYNHRWELTFQPRHLNAPYPFGSVAPVQNQQVVVFSTIARNRSISFWVHCDGMRATIQR